MDYLIYCDKQLIAQFQHESDRDIALSALREAFSDCVFTTK